MDFMGQSELFNASEYDFTNNYNKRDDPYFEERVQHEIHRMTGLLRFTPDESGVYIAYCAPDYFILPELAEHFTARFGDTPWKIIDEKRGLCLSRQSGEKVKLERTNDCAEKIPDNWEELWRHYHKTINNESRKNIALQRQFMPERYWKYLPELGGERK